MRCVVVPNEDLSAKDFNGAFARFESLDEVVDELDQLLI
jgi:hypothetical protein